MDYETFDPPSNAVATPQVPAPDSAFRQGLRSGVTSLGGQFHALAGQAAEGVGMEELAAQQRAASVAAQQQAAAESEGLIHSYKDVHDLRDAFNYATGMAGSSLPVMGMGAAGGVAARFIPGGKGLAGSIIGNAAGMAPSTIGTQFESQQADPQQAKKSFTDRTLTGLGAGGAQAAAMAAVPGAIEGRLLGRAAEGAVAVPLRESLANAIPDAIAGNAAAMGGATAIDQAAASHLNPNRDTSGDAQAMKDAAVEGGIFGGILAPLGVASELRGAKSTPGSFLEDTKSLFSNKSRDPVDLAEAKKIAADQELITPADLHGRDPEQVFAESDQNRLSKATEWAQQLFADPLLTPEKRASLEAATSDLTDRANQATVAGMKVAKDLGQKVTEQVSDLYKSLTKKAPDAELARSEDNSGVRQKITETIAPLLDESYAESLPVLSDTIGKVVEKARVDGRVSDVVMGKLQNVLGDQTRSILTAVHDKLIGTGGDEAHTDNFYKVMTKLADTEVAHKTLEDTVRSALKPDVAKDVSPADVKDAVSHIKDFVSERHTANMTKAQADLYKRDIYTSLKDHFGDKTDSVLKAFTDDAAKNSKQSVDDRAPMTEAENGSVNAADQYEVPRYYGKGKDGSGLIQTEAGHMLKYGNDKSPAKDLLAKAQRENPDRNVSFVDAKDLPADHPGRVAHEAAGLPLEGHGIVTAEGMKQEGRLTPAELDSMKLDTSKTSHLDSASRIDTGVKGVTLDAKRVAATMNGKLEFNESDDKSGMHRLARSFMEGIAAAADHLGMPVEPKDNVVVAVRGGRDVTFGELRKLSMRPEDPAWMKGKTEEEINATLQTKENLADSTLAQLRKYEPQMHDILTKREGALQGEIRRLKQDGTKLTKEDLKQLRKTFKVDEAKDALFHLERELETRDQGAAKERITDGVRHGSEVAPESNIHDAVAGLGEAGVARKTGFDGGALKYEGKGSLVEKDGSLTDLGRRALSTKIAQMEAGKTAIMRKLAEKARALEDKVESMKPRDQLELGAIVKEKDIGAIAETVNSLAAKYKDVGGFTDRVLAGGKSLESVLKNVAKSDDVAALQKSVAALLKVPKGNEHSAKALDAINARLGELVSKDPSTAYDMMKSHQSTGGSTMGDAEMKAVKDHIEKVLGTTVKTEFARMFHAGEFERVNGADIIRVSVHSLDPMSVAYHESLHAFFQQLRDSGDHESLKPLYRAADTAVVKGQLRKLLMNEPEALKQIEGSAEERVAYMYQFWAKGQLHLGDGAKGVLGKIGDFFRKVLGTWSNDERALHVMEYFNSGEYAKNIGDRNAVTRALEEGTNPALRSAKKLVEPLTRLSSSVMSAGDARMRDTGNPALTKLADLIHRETTGHGQDHGFIPAAREMRSKMMNDLAASLKDVNAEHLQAALESLQKKVPAVNAEARLAAASVRKVLDNMYHYMKDAGVDVGDKGVGKDYFPRVWDAGYISAHQVEFNQMLEPYIKSGAFTGSPQQLIARLMRSEGSDMGIETSTPGMQHVKERKLDFFKDSDIAPFMQKDLYQTLNSYITQGTRRAEWAKRFGDDGSGLRGLLKEAKDKHGASPAELDTAQQYVMGVDGTLGDDINPALRRAFGNMIVYQNVRLLPLAIFSSVIDPIGLMVRGGTVGDAFTTFKRGIGEVSKNFKKDGGSKDASYQLAEDMGVIDNSMLMHTLGSSYSQGMVGDLGRKVNDTFFRYNLMEQFNTSMRVGATEAAVKFIAKHADGKSNLHSERWLAELGLKPGEVMVKDGRPLLRQHEFESTGMNTESSVEMANKMSAAVNKWVDGAILRPNAAHKPIWMNDPHYALIAHLKQFVYSFQETIIKRVVNEARHGNYNPSMALAGYVPVMIGADLIKGMIQGGGSQPDWKEGWDAGDYLWSGVQRAGLLGVGQFGADVAKNIHEGGVGVGALAGPTVEQLGDAVHVVGGHGQFAPFALKAMPANALYATSLGGQATDPAFAD